MNGFLLTLVALSLKATLVALLVVAVQRLAGRRLPASLRYGLWSLVLARLALPVLPESPFSLLRAGAAAGDLLPGLGPLPASRIAPPASSELALGGGLRTLLDGWLVGAGAGLLLGIWSLGVIVYLGRRARAALRLRRALRRARPLDDPATAELLARCRERLGIRRHVTLCVTPAVSTPALCGILRPHILLPAALAGELDRARLEHVVLHELAHLSRWDGAVFHLATLLVGLHWFNPAAHWMLRRMTTDCELACDARVLSRLPAAARAAYGHTLLQLSLPRLRPALLALSFAGTPKRDLERRIAMIASFRKPTRAWTLAGLALFAALAAVALTDLPAVAAPADGASADDLERQKQTIAATRAIGTAMFAYLKDEHAGEVEAEEPPGGVVDWSRCEPITHGRLSAKLVPTYVDELPAADGWGHRFEFCLAPTAPYLVLGVRSPGRDGVYDDSSYASGAFRAHDVDRDVVWSDGYFVRWPGPIEG